MSEPRRARLVPGDDIELAVVAEYYQYVASDAVTITDFRLGDMINDGVISPQRTGLQFNTGVQLGTISVGLHAWGPPPPELAHEVAAACDLELDSGKLDIASLSWKLATIDWGHPVRVRLHVGMSGRDRSLAIGNGDHERHDIHVWETDQPQPRWRSQHIDGIGARLAVTTTHVGPDIGTQ